MRRAWNFIEKIDERYGIWLVYIALIAFFINPIWFHYANFQDWQGYFVWNTERIAAYCCLLRLLLMSRRYPWYVICSLMAIAFVHRGGFFAEDKTLYYFVIMMLASKGADFRKILSIYLGFFTFLILLDIPLYLMGEVTDYGKHRISLVGHSWGFSNPNLLAILISTMVFCVLTLWNKNRTAAVWGICILSALIIGWMTLCMTIIVALVLFPILYQLFIKRRPKAWQIALLPSFGLVISALLALWYGPSAGTNTFNCRFAVSAFIWKDWGISLMGQNCLVPFTPNGGIDPKSLILDNLFLRLPLLYGFIPALIGYILWSYSLWKIARHGSLPLLTSAVCITLCGFMEVTPLFIILNPTLLYSPHKSSYNASNWRKMTYLHCGLGLLFVIGLYNPFANKALGSGQNKIKDIEPLEGFSKVSNHDERSFATYLRGLPLSDQGQPVLTYLGEEADSASKYCHRVIDIPLLSESEQCADVCLYLRADYLFRQHRFFDIHFEDTQHNIMRHKWCGLRRSFEKYLRHVFEWANTESMKNEMPTRNLKDIQVGDVWVYDAKSRPEVRYGHAMMVADVCKNPNTGETAILLLQGSTPACSIHILENTLDSEHSPWFILDEKADTLDFGMAKYLPSELRYFKN